jgi:GNAT superfamily N-acetyltransferase
MEWEKDGYLISTDPDLLDINRICRWLHGSYWAAARSRELIERSIRHSIPFGLYRESSQIGFARLVTDYATFAWFCDVIIDPVHRGTGLGKWLVDCAMSHPDISTSMKLLRTRDAHGLYEQYGFAKVECMMRQAPTPSIES